MAQFYSGIINLSKIPKELIRENRAGEKIIYVDFAERRTPSAYGDTHYIKLYDAANRQTHYIGDFRPREIGGSAPAPSPAPEPAPRPMNNARAEYETTRIDDDLPDFLK
jgi:hypothetical protein